MIDFIPALSLFALAIIFYVQRAREHGRRQRRRAAIAAFNATLFNPHESCDAATAQSIPPNDAQVIRGRLVRPVDHRLAKLLRTTTRDGEQN